MMRLVMVILLPAMPMIPCRSKFASFLAEWRIRSPQGRLSGLGRQCRRLAPAAPGWRRRVRPPRSRFRQAVSSNHRPKGIEIFGGWPVSLLRPSTLGTPLCYVLSRKPASARGKWICGPYALTLSHIGVQLFDGGRRSARCLVRSSRFGAPRRPPTSFGRNGHERPNGRQIRPRLPGGGPQRKSPLASPTRRRFP